VLGPVISGGWLFATVLFATAAGHPRGVPVVWRNHPLGGCPADCQRQELALRQTTQGLASPVESMARVMRSNSNFLMTQAEASGSDIPSHRVGL